MARILALDLGKVRTGIAVTDSLQIIATGLETVLTKDLIDYLKKYFIKESVEAIVMGYPKTLENKPSEMAEDVKKMEKILISLFPSIPVYLEDERFTSKIAKETLFQLNTTKKNRAVKGHTDKISSVIILQSFLEKKSNQ